MKYESLSGRSVERRSSHLSAAECYTEANVSAHLTGKKKQEEEVANLLLVRYSYVYSFSKLFSSTFTIAVCLHGGREKTEQRVISISMVPQAAFSRWCRSLHNGLNNAATVLCLLHWKVGFMDARANTNFEMRCIKRK